MTEFTRDRQDKELFLIGEFVAVTLVFVPKCLLIEGVKLSLRIDEYGRCTWVGILADCF